MLHPLSTKRVARGVVALLLAAAFVLPPAAYALDVNPAFNPSVLIQDASFNDTKTFGGPEGIQRFLESKNSVLKDTSPEFLSKLGEPSSVALKTQLEDPQPNLGRLRTAAELIWDASRASGINPQVILVTLHKEQGLIGPVSPDRQYKALRNAMGFACPDSLGCGDLLPGFYFQLFGNVDTQGNRYLGAAKSLMKSFNTPDGRGPSVNNVPAKVGQTVEIGNTLGDYAGIPARQTVTMGNRATAALYRYTPHVFNGNYNFWNFFRSWFKYPNGTLLKSTFDSTVFIIQNGERQRVPAFVAVSRGLALGNAVAASPTEINDYPQGPTYGPTDNTVISINGQFYVFINSVKHPASSFVLSQRKLDPAKITPVSDADAALYAVGPQLTPNDGTVLKAASTPDVYLVDKGVLKKFSEFTYKQHAAAPKLQVIADTEVATYPKSGWVAPKDGTLIKGRLGDSSYVMSQGRRLPLTAELFKNRGYLAKNVTALTTDDELASIPLGPVATPAEGTYFAMGKELFIFKNGTKHPIFGFVARQRGMTADYRFEESIAGNWPDGIAIAPRDGTLYRGATNPTVYVTAKGQGRALTGELFKLLRYSFKNVVTLPDNEAAALPKAGFATPPENTYFSVKETGEFFLFQAGTKRRIAPFVAKQKGMTPDYAFASEAADTWDLGKPVAPREGTLLKASGTQDLYLFTLGQLRPLSNAAFARRGYSASRVLTVPASDLAGYEKGAAIVK